MVRTSTVLHRIGLRGGGKRLSTCSHRLGTHSWLLDREKLDQFIQPRKAATRPRRRGVAGQSSPGTEEGMAACRETGGVVAKPQADRSAKPWSWEAEQRARPAVKERGGYKPHKRQAIQLHGSRLPLPRSTNAPNENHDYSVIETRKKSHKEQRADRLT